MRNTKYLFIIIALLSAVWLTACQSGLAAAREQTETNNSAAIPWQPKETTDRTESAQENYEMVFGDLELSINQTNPEYADIINNFICGDVYNQSDLLDVRERELITLVSLTTNQSYELLKLHAVGAIHAGLIAEEVMEAVYHCTPYVGIATTYEAVLAVTEAFVDNDIALPLSEQTQIADDERFVKGNDEQIAVFGEFMRRSEESVEDGITKYVTEWCFGDFYTRGAIEPKLRELLTMCILANMGVDQLGAHVMGARSVGYSQEEIVAAITQCMPYMGTPRTLSAISVVENAFAPREEQENN